MGKTTYLLILIRLTSFLVSSQNLPIERNQKLNDSLRQILKSSQFKKLTFSKLYFAQNNYDKLNKELRTAYTNELLGRKDLMEIDSLRAEAYYKIGGNLEYMGDDFPKAKYYLEQSLKLFTKLKNHKRTVDALRYLAIYHQSVDEDSVAISYYTKSRIAAEKIQYKEGILKPYIGLIFMYTKMGLYHKAIQYSKESFRVTKIHNVEYLNNSLYNNSGNAYLKNGDAETALKMYKNALAVCTNVENRIRYCSNIGNTFLVLNKIDSAQKYLDKVEKLLPQVDVPRIYIFAYSYIAKLRLAKNNPVEAKKYALLAMKYANEYRLESISDDALLTLFSTYKQLNQPDSALNAHEKYWKVKGRFLEKSRNNIIANVEQAFLQFKKDAQIKDLQQEKKLSITQRNWFIGLLLLALFSTYFIYFLVRKRHLQEQIVKNLQLEKANLELKTATQQLNDFAQNISEKNLVLEKLENKITQQANPDLELLAQLQKSTILTDEAWERFSVLFEKVHIGYLHRLRQKLPDLSPAEIRYMVLAKLRFTNKEMANSLGVSAQAIRVMLHRMRRKLNLVEDGAIDELVESI